jgi:hypothetical protein
VEPPRHSKARGLGNLASNSKGNVGGGTGPVVRKQVVDPELGAGQGKELSIRVIVARNVAEVPAEPAALKIII